MLQEVRAPRYTAYQIWSRPYQMILYYIFLAILRANESARFLLYEIPFKQPSLHINSAIKSVCEHPRLWVPVYSGISVQMSTAPGLPLSSGAPYDPRLILQEGQVFLGVSRNPHGSIRPRSFIIQTRRQEY